MNDFATYYKTNFRKDINQFFATIPDESKFHEDSSTQQIFSIQYERLTQDFDHLNFLTKDDIEYFGVALYFTVLADMVCYTYHKLHYESFRRLTLYPKFIGNCPGGCCYHFNPSDIFAAMNYSRKNPIDILSKERFDFYEKFNEAIPTRKNEIIDFFNKHLIEVDGVKFWDMCIAEFPYRVKNIEN